MILLDINVVSETMRTEPHPSVTGWLDAQAAETLFLSSITVAEAMFGVGASLCRSRDQSARGWKGISHAGRLYRRDRRSARVRRGVARCRRVHSRRPPCGRSLDCRWVERSGIGQAPKVYQGFTKRRIACTRTAQTLYVLSEA